MVAGKREEASALVPCFSFYFCLNQSSCLSPCWHLLKYTYCNHLDACFLTRLPKNGFFILTLLTFGVGLFFVVRLSCGLQDGQQPLWSLHMRCSSTSPQVVTTENVSKASTGVVPKHKDDILIIFEAPAHNSVTDAQRIFQLPIQHFIEVWELKAQLSEVMHYLNLVGYT